MENNNNKPNRFDYVAYDETATNLQADFKFAFQAIENRLATLGATRHTSLAATKLEEAYMWIGKAIRDDQINRNGSSPLQEARNNG